MAAAAELPGSRAAGETSGLQSDRLKAILERVDSAEPFDAREFERQAADRYNRTPGNLHETDGYECAACMNRGHLLRAEESHYGYPYAVCVPCECMMARESIRRLRASGLENAAKRYRFDNYAVTSEWQSRIYQRATAFATDAGSAWFFIGGAVGAGKTHICTAIAVALMAKWRLKYAIWPDEAAYLKAAQMDDPDAYQERVNQLKSMPVLYVDDFFKITKDRDGRAAPPTAADVRLAHEILNFRYLGDLKTLISSERMLPEIIDVDAAIGGRIAERAGAYALNIARDRERDYRLALASASF